MKYVHYDNQNSGDNILGFYDGKIHLTKSIPTPNIEITDAVWVDCLSNQGLRHVDLASKSISSYTPPLDSFDSYVIAAKNDIDIKAGEVRKRFISDGDLIVQEYLLAESEADAYKAAGYTGTVPTTVQDEMNNSGTDATTATDTIISKAAALRAALASIRTLRLNGKDSISALTSVDPASPTQAEVDAVTAARDAAIAALDAVQPTVTGS